MANAMPARERPWNLANLQIIRFPSHTILAWLERVGWRINRLSISMGFKYHYPVAFKPLYKHALFQYWQSSVGDATGTVV